MREKEYRIWPGLVVSLLLAFACGVFVYQVMGFTYDIADDIIMRDIASGAFTGTPDGHLIFVRYVLGFLISRLYLLNRSVDWYGFVIAGAPFLGFAAVLYRGLSAKKNLGWKAVYAGFAIGIFILSTLMYLVWFQWTVSAAVVGASALYLYATISIKSDGPGIADGIFIWLLLTLTYSIRTMVFLMVLPGFAIVFLCRFLRKNERKLCFRWKEVFLPAAVFLSVGIVAVIEAFAYPGAEWEEYERFQDARLQVYDYSGVPSYENHTAFYEEIGLNEHEVRNLRHYAFYLVEGMDAEMLGKIGQISEQTSSMPAGFFGKLKSGVKLVMQQMSEQQFLPIGIPMLLFLIASVFLTVRYQKLAFIPLLLFLCVEGGLWLKLGFSGRLPERVTFAMYLVQVMGLAALFYQLYLLAEEEKLKEIQRGWKGGKVAVLDQRHRRIITGIFLFLCFGAVVLRGMQVYKVAPKEPANYQLFKDGCKNDTDRLYFIETYMAEPLGGAMVTARGDFRQNRCVTLGDWYSTSPLDQKRFESLGITNAEETILTDPNAYLVVRNEQEPGFYEGYFAEKYPGCRLVCCESREINGREYYFYQVQR